MKTMCVCILLTASACAHHDVSVCRHNAVFAAILHQAENQEDEVLLCLGWNEYRREWHAQAKYRKQGGGWIFLKNSPLLIRSGSLGITAAILFRKQSL